MAALINKKLNINKTEQSFKDLKQSAKIPVTKT
jgi:hypothetical protein